MLIKKKLFSVLDEEGNLGYYLYDEYTGEEKMFSEKKRNRNNVALEDVDSHRGLGRSVVVPTLLTGIPSGVGGAVGGYVAKRHAEKLDREGHSDEKILKGAKRRGGEAGAIGGAALGLGAGLAFKKAGLNPAIPTIVGAAGGALGGYLGAGKNTKDRLMKRRMKELDRRRD